ncbi:MAG: Error-prone repair protein ImuA [Chitinophagaceae bacterium]
MPAARADILQRLQKEILPLQGFKHLPTDIAVDFGLGLVNEAFPNQSFPLSAMHEFMCESREYATAASGFVACLTGTLMKRSGASVWISKKRSIFPPALATFGISPDQMIFITTQTEKETAWVMEEALKCEGIAAVIAELAELSFIASRRLQLAVEQSRVTGFIIRNQPRSIGINACVARWMIKPLLSETGNQLPGIGFPRWNVELLKIRNGRPGSWQLEWKDGRFESISSTKNLLTEYHKRKVG